MMGTNYLLSLTLQVRVEIAVVLFEHACDKNCGRFILLFGVHKSVFLQLEFGRVCVQPSHTHRCTHTHTHTAHLITTLLLTRL